MGSAVVVVRSTVQRSSITVDGHGLEDAFQRGRDRQELKRWERQELERERERQREAKRLRRRLRKQLALLKDVITRDVLLTKNLHSLCEYLRFNLGNRSHCY